jgi:DnaJ-class molecular chaperone
MKAPSNPIVHPAHYTFSAIEPIDVIEAWQLGFHLGNVLKYVARAGRKESKLDDLKKARWYLDREIKSMEEGDVETNNDDDGRKICPECNGIGTSRFSSRPDDYGPHVICLTCRGTGLLRRDG